MTAEEFLHLPDTDRPKELVRGRVEYRCIPYPRHCHYCTQVAFRLRESVKEKQKGWVLINNVGVITEREPDTVRSPDIAFYSFDRIPNGRLPDGCAQAAPELIVEVKSKDDSQRDLLSKTAEYLFAEVSVICIVDPDTETVHVFSADQPPRVLTAADEWTLPEVLPGFSVKLSELFVA